MTLDVQLLVNSVRVPPGCISPFIVPVLCDVTRVECFQIFLSMVQNVQLILILDQLTLDSAIHTPPAPNEWSKEQLYWTDIGSLVSFNPFGLLKKIRKVSL